MDSLFESIRMVAVAVQQRVGCSGKRLRNWVLGIEVVTGEGAESECRELVEDCVVAAASKVAAVAVVVGMVSVAKEMKNIAMDKVAVAAEYSVGGDAFDVGAKDGIQWNMERTVAGGEMC